MAHKKVTAKRFSRARTLILASCALLVLTCVVLHRGISSAAASPVKHPAPPKTLRLYVFDCGKLAIADVSVYGFTESQLASSVMSVECFLIVHPKGTLIWDVGTLPDSLFTSSTSGSVTKGRATVNRPLKAELAEIGYTPADITYLALSHYH